MPAILANRSPNEPMLTPRTRSPGDSVLTTAASSPPDPAVVIIATSDVVPKYGFMPVEDPGEHRRELRTAVVDHLPRAGLADAGWQRGRARDAQVRLEAGHGTLLVADQAAHARTT